MQIGTLIKIAIPSGDEIGIVIQRVPNEFSRWEVIGLSRHVGFKYVLSFPNKYAEVICK